MQGMKVVWGTNVVWGTSASASEAITVLINGEN